MKRVTLAVAISLCLAGAGAPVMAQVVVVPAGERAEQAIRNTEQALNDARRVAAVASGLLSDPRLATAATPEAFAAVVEPRRAEIGAGRAEIQAIRARLQVLPQVSRPSDPPQMRMSDQTVRDVAAMAGRIDALMGDVLAVADGVRDGQRDKAMRAIVAVATGSVTMIQAQAVTLRAQAATLPENTSNHGMLTAMACLSDGVASLQQGIMGMMERPAAIAALRVAQTCTAERASAGRQALEREIATPSPHAELNRLTARLAPLSISILDELDRGGVTLGSAAAALERGDSLQKILGAEFATFQQIMTRIQSLSAQQGAIQADQLE